MSIRRSLSRVILALALLPGAQPVLAQWTFDADDHIAIVGNALPDRMQHTGWLEAYLQTANSAKHLVVRTLAFSGDEVASMHREEGYPSPDEYLALVEADVIFAFFGYNESYRHDPELFKTELASYIDDMRSKQFNGSSPPRLVLFSPIAHEDLDSPNLPDGEENNLWLSIYTDAMARVAHDKNVTFVDLFAPSKMLYEQNDEPLTINGVHLNDRGNHEIARVILRSLDQSVEEEHIDLVRAAVLDKNWCWFNRYHATDGNDVWGSRSVLKFVDEQTNAEVLQHELVMLDIMAANRDEVIWKAAVGETVAPDDSDVPHPILVKTNFAPSEKNGALSYVPADQGVETLTLAEGLTANLFASEETFPELVNPVQMDVDTKGRLWVAAWETYPKWQPDREMLDRLLILPDEDRDGVADEAITFAYVHNPTAFTFWNGGVIVASVPNILFLKDTDGDDRADTEEILFSGMDSADTHHSANGFDYGPDGYIYYQRGIFNVSNVETPWQSAQLSRGRSGMYRFNPRTFRFSFHAENSPNPHGGDFNYWGYHFATDATSGRAFQVRMDGAGGFAMHELLEKTVRPVPSSGILSSTHFPEKYNGNFIILNAIGFLGIKQYTLENTDGEFWGTEAEDLLVSSDGNFRPADFKVGDDGALYVSDWSNALIGHMQHNIRDPSRDHDHGRVYRITADGRPLEAHVEIDGQPIETLLDVLKHPTDGVRLRARIELSERDTSEVVAAAVKWIEQFDISKPEDAHHLLEALWLHQQHDVVNEGLLTVLLNSPDSDARRAAERVKYMWEIEGKIGASAGSAMNHADHGAHGEEDVVYDYFSQEKSPDPVMEGDTMVIHIQTLIEQMKYDRRAFAVGPGMKVRIIFSNPDAMDHNLIIVQPGASSQVAMAAMMLGADGIEKSWIPESNKILAASGMLSMGETETIEFTAPTQVGQYDYLCTFPGHYLLMNGVMHVVEDVDAWMAANKDTAQGAEREFVQEWTVADFDSDLDKPRGGDSLAKGEAVFEAASCAACHLPNEQGGRVGPDLADGTKPLDALAMLTEILDPSKVINEDFKSWQLKIETEDVFEDDTVYGLIVEENDEYVRVLTDPLQDIEGIRIPVEKIVERTPAPLSTMPTGMMNSFTREEVLDLLAYLQSIRAGEDSHVVYEGAGGIGAGKHIVFIASDHEYRGEETLPALARIMAKHYGFKCTVVFGVDPETGNLLPGSSEIRGLDVLQDADLMVVFMRFINMPDDEMQHFVDYVDRGGPIMGLRTSTHAFKIPADRKFHAYDWQYPGEEFHLGFGRQVLGETWVTHYGTNHEQSSRLEIMPDQADHPILRGVEDMHTVAGCYTADPIEGSVVLAKGIVLNGMDADAPVDTTKEAMPVAWVRTYTSKSGKDARIFATTQGASEDILNDGFRRLLVNAHLWCLGMEEQIDANNPIDFVGPYHPTTFSFTEFRRGIKPADLAGWATPILNPDAPLTEEAGAVRE